MTSLDLHVIKWRTREVLWLAQGIQLVRKRIGYTCLTFRHLNYLGNLNHWQIDCQATDISGSQEDSLKYVLSRVNPGMMSRSTQKEGHACLICNILLVHPSLFASLMFDYSLSLTLNMSFRRVTVSLWQNENCLPWVPQHPQHSLHWFRLALGQQCCEKRVLTPSRPGFFLGESLRTALSQDSSFPGLSAHFLPSLQSRLGFLPQPASFCFLPGWAHRLPMTPQGIALLLPQLQSVHISLN